MAGERNERTRRCLKLPLYAQPEVHERRWFLLGVLCLSLIMVVMAVSSLNVAMPTLQTELDTSATMLQWIVDSYALVFAGLLLTAGALGDRFGRKGALLVGLGGVRPRLADQRAGRLGGDSSSSAGPCRAPARRS